MTNIRKDELDHIFTYHPATQSQVVRYTELRNKAKEFAEMILDLCPYSADRSTAVRCVREAIMWANASIALEHEADQ